MIRSGDQQKQDRRPGESRPRCADWGFCFVVRHQGEPVGDLSPKRILTAAATFAAEFPEPNGGEAGFDSYIAKTADLIVIDALIR